MPKVKDIFSQLNRAKYFSTLDLQAGYHHIPLDESSIPKTAFTSPFGKYEYIKVPFGLAQASAYFQELMTGVLKDFSFAIAYLDNIIIFSRTAEEYHSHIKQVLRSCRMHTYQWTLANATSSLRKSSTSDTASYYGKFIKNFAKMAKPLSLLTHQKAKFEWTLVHHTAFLMLKESVTQAPILCYPDPTKWFIVYTDAKDDACEAQPFLSHTFMDTQKKCRTTEQEAYIVYYAVTKLNYYLQGAEVIVHTITTNHWQDF